MIPTRKILIGDVRETIKQIESNSCQCIVTSPPYYNLRAYGDDPREIGREKTPQEYIAKMVEFFREVKRVLRPDGTLWVNIGDSYAASRSYQVSDNKNVRVGPHNNIGRSTPPDGFKQKDMLMIPARLAIALCDDGWYLRSDIIEEVELYCPCGCGYVLQERIWRHGQDREIIWKKPNPMPESVCDRPTKSHEYIFLLTKSSKYFYDAEAIKEPVTGTANPRGNGVNPKAKHPSGLASDTGRRHDELNGRYPRNKQNKSFSSAISGTVVSTRNKRSVWEVATSPFSDAHFATFPPDLIRPCILAGSRNGDTVFDPFLGSGTTGEVAGELCRNFIGCELYEKFMPMIERRTAEPGFML